MVPPKKKIKLRTGVRVLLFMSFLSSSVEDIYLPENDLCKILAQLELVCGSIPSLRWIFCEGSANTLVGLVLELIDAVQKNTGILNGTHGACPRE